MCLKWSIKLSGGDILLISHTNSPDHHNIKCNVNCYLNFLFPFSKKRSTSPCMSSRSSPLLAAPRSPCPEGPPEPFSDGAEVQVANLDYRMSRKDLQQTLYDTFSRYGRVRPIPLILMYRSNTPVSMPVCLLSIIIMQTLCIK